LYSFYAYGIYRNGESIATTTATVFGQSFLKNGEYLYEVSAIYVRNNNWYESDKQEARISVNYTGIDKTQKENAVNIFPNPLSKGRMLTIDLGVDNTGEAVFYNLSGQSVKKESLRSRITSCSVDLPSGTYLVRILLETGEVFTAKIIVK
jgi:hypothetical protein